MESNSSQSAGLVKLLAWLEVNKKQLLIWGSACLVIVLAGVVVVMLQKQREIRASEALSEVKVPPSLSTELPSGTADAYLKVARDYAGTKAGGRALLLHASVFFTEKKYAEAQVRFEEFLADYGNSPWVPQALFGIASCLDAQEKSDEAIAKYEELRRRFQTHALVDESRLSLARLYEDNNRLEEAFQIYEELVETHSGSGLGAEAGLRREDMLERYPQLAKTNVPPLTAIQSPELSVTSALPILSTNAPPVPTNQPGSNSPGSIPTSPSPPTNEAATTLEEKP